MDRNKQINPTENTAVKSTEKRFKLNGEAIRKTVYENRFALIAAACTSLIMIVVYFCYDLFPFGNITILRMDLYHQYGPLYAEFYDRIVNGSSFLYSWTTGGGSSFLGNYLNYVSSPFSFLILLFGHKNMPEAIAAIILLKAAAASFTSSYYFGNSQKLKSPATSAFGVLYACSGFFIAYYWNVMWLDGFYLLPLVALGIEKLINERKMKLYYLSLVLAALTNFYMAYMLAIFSVLYFFAYYFGRHTLNDTYFGKLASVSKDKAPLKRLLIKIGRFFRNSRFLDSGVRFAFTSLGALLSCAFLLVPLYYILNACSATSDSWPQNWKTYFSVFDFLSNHLAYLNPTIRSSGEDVLPNIYCGVLPLLLLPLYLFSKKTSVREKAADITLLGVFFASFYLNKLNFIWHGFHFPNDLPYRFSNMYSFLLLILAFKAYKSLKEFTGRQILGAGVAVILFSVLVQEIGSKNFTELTLWITIAFAGIYVSTLCMLRDKRYPAYAVAALLLCAVCAEYTVANTNHYSMDQSKQSYTGDYDDFVAVKDMLDKQEGNDRYRMELTKIRARMDPAWYGYNGVSTFSSMAYEKVSNLHYHLGLYSNYINSHTYNPQTPVYNAMFALKYLVDNSSKISNHNLYTEVASYGTFKAYRNNYYLPIAFRTDSNLSFWVHDDNNPFANQNSFIENATGVPEVLKNIAAFDAQYSDIDYFTDEEFATGNFYYNKTEGVGEGTVTMSFIVPETQNTYIYLRSSSSSVKAIDISSDYGYFASQAIDTKPYVFDLGIREAGETLKVKIPITGGNSGVLYLHVAGLDMEAFSLAYDMLREDSLNVTSFEDTKITGDINVSADGILYTSISYDEGWSVFIDGERVYSGNYIKSADALLGVPITAGYHTVEFKYSPRGMVIGAAISILTVGIAVLFYLLTKLKAFEFCPKTAREEELESLEAQAPIILHSGDINLEDTVIYFDPLKKSEKEKPGEEDDKKS
ncbi:MAG: Bacterial membrane protein YfhO [Firmicutes bacterium ADurb.Bin300]|nr:MAG: Bacterial membrane protein YfhO [Firmicutes bacterium ADurb.Bin300]